MSLYKSFSSLGCNKKIETFENFENIQENMNMDYNKKMNIISKNPIVCVKVYSDSCGACNNIKSVYEKFTEEYGRKGCLLVRQPVNSYDNNKEPRLQGYPTFHIYYKGQLHSDVLGADIPLLQTKLNNLILLHNKNNVRETYVENLETQNPIMNTETMNPRLLLDLNKPCKVNEDCKTNKCARQSAADGAPKVCSNSIISFAAFEYSGDMKKNDVCWTGAMCGGAGGGNICRNTNREKNKGFCGPCPNNKLDTGHSCVKQVCFKGKCTYDNLSRPADCVRNNKKTTNMGLFCSGRGKMKCETNETKKGVRCYKNCAPGYDNAGEFCVKLKK